MVLNLRYLIFIAVLIFGFSSSVMALEACWYSQRSDISGYSVSVFQKGNVHPIQQVRSSTALFNYLSEIDGSICAVDWKKARDQFDYTLSNFAGQAEPEGLKIEYYPLFDKKIAEPKDPALSTPRENASN